MQFPPPPVLSVRLILSLSQVWRFLPSLTAMPQHVRELMSLKERTLLVTFGSFLWTRKFKKRLRLP
jgi:hypothetical protein